VQVACVENIKEFVVVLSAKIAQADVLVFNQFSVCRILVVRDK
jgi:hypothetical protein